MKYVLGLEGWKLPICLQRTGKAAVLKLRWHCVFQTAILYLLLNLLKSSSQCPGSVSFLGPSLERLGHGEDVSDEIERKESKRSQGLCPENKFLIILCVHVHATPGWKAITWKTKRGAFPSSVFSRIRGSSHPAGACKLDSVSRVLCEWALSALLRSLAAEWCFSKT